MPEPDNAPILPHTTQAAAECIAAMAHDLRAPLAAVHMAAELLCEDLDELDAAQAQQLALTIQRGTRWLQHLAENLYTFTTMQEHGLILDRRPLDLRAVVEDCARTIGPVLSAKQQQCVIQQPAPLPLVLADRSQIARVCANLLTNANKFAAPGTVIEGRLTGTEDWVRLAVADRGPGLPSGDVSQLFDPFYQPPNTASNGGVGLGLAIVRDLVHAHGGRVGAENRKGGGARIWFELPALGNNSPSPDGARQEPAR